MSGVTSTRYADAPIEFYRSGPHQRGKNAQQFCSYGNSSAALVLLYQHLKGCDGGCAYVIVLTLASKNIPGIRMTPDYWPQACKDLSRRCDIMKTLIATYPEASLRTRGNPFQTLARAIVGQQISVKAAQSVWNKTVLAVETITPETILAAAADDLRAAGLSRQKINYLRDLSAHFAEGRIKPRRWHSLADDAVISELIEVKGIGRWTAEMFLIFYLMRPNVWPIDDIGLIRAVEKHYHGGERIARLQIAAHFERFSPWATVATWYLWRSLDPIPVEY